MGLCCGHHFCSQHFAATRFNAKRFLLARGDWYGQIPKCAGQCAFSGANMLLGASLAAELGAARCYQVTELRFPQQFIVVLLHCCAEPVVFVFSGDCVLSFHLCCLLRDLLAHCSLVMCLLLPLSCSRRSMSCFCSLQRQVLRSSDSKEETHMCLGGESAAVHTRQQHILGRATGMEAQHSA